MNTSTHTHTHTLHLVREFLLTHTHISSKRCTSVCKRVRLWMIGVKITENHKRDNKGMRNDGGTRSCYMFALMGNVKCYFGDSCCVDKKRMETVNKWWRSINHWAHITVGDKSKHSFTFSFEHFLKFLLKFIPDLDGNLTTDYQNLWSVQQVYKGSSTILNIIRVFSVLNVFVEP